MNKPFILLTGDDSVRAEGLILVRRIVEKFADVAIIATKTQQSAVGGKMNFKQSTWGKEIVDGFETIWVDGSPVDAVHFAFDYLEKKPDFVISGMNIGENVDTSLLASGTFSAALRAFLARETPAIALSFEMSSISDLSWMNEHSGEFRNELLEYPGEILEKIVKMFIERSKVWSGVWNVNFPYKPTKRLKFCANYANNYFLNRIDINENYTFDYAEVESDLNMRDITKWSDVDTMKNGYVAITPIKWDLNDWDEITQLNKIYPN